MFNSKKITNLLDIDRAKSVFSVFFLFTRDPALGESEQITLDEILQEIFLGHSIPRGVRKRLNSIYQETMSEPPPFDRAVDTALKDLSGDREALVSFIKILLRLISDDGMVSKKHCKDLHFLLSRCDFTLVDLEKFTDDEQILLSFALPEIEGSSYLNTTLYYSTLECSPDAPIEEIKKAYRVLVMKYHPDRSSKHHSKNIQDEKSIEKFQEIQIAYTSLMNILERKI